MRYAAASAIIATAAAQIGQLTDGQPTATAVASYASAVASSSAQEVYTTKIVTHLTTYCPEATMITAGGSTYTVTEATTLTISDCSCTMTEKVTSASAIATPTSAVVVETSMVESSASAVATSAAVGELTEGQPTATAIASAMSSVASAVQTSAAVGELSDHQPTATAIVSAMQSTLATSAAPVMTSAMPVYGNGTASGIAGATGTSSSYPQYTGAATKASGAGLAAIFGLAAFLL